MTVLASKHQASSAGLAKWSKWDIAGTKPPPRHFHVVAYIAARESVYMYGGFNGDSWLSDCWAFHLPSRTWTPVTCPGTPGPCERASAVAFPLHGDKLLIHGGYSGNAFLSDLWLLHTSWQGVPGQHHWQRIKREPGGPAAFMALNDMHADAASAVPLSGAAEPQGHPPLPAGEAAAAAAQGDATPQHMDHRSMPDVWGEDAQLAVASDESRGRLLAAMASLHPGVGGTHSEWPAARSGHNGVQLGPLIIIFGGRYTGGRYNDVHALNTDHMSWTRIKCTGDLPPTRKTHASARISTDLYMCGGHSGEMWLDDMFQLDLRSVLRQVAPPVTIPRPLPSLQGDLARLLQGGNATGMLGSMLHSMNALPGAEAQSGAGAGVLLDTAASTVLLGITSALRSQFVPPHGAEHMFSRRSKAIAAAVAAHRVVDRLILQRYNLDCSPCLGDSKRHNAGQAVQPWVPLLPTSSTGGSASLVLPSIPAGVAPGGEASCGGSNKTRRTHSQSSPAAACTPATDTLQLVAPSAALPSTAGTTDCSDILVHVQGRVFAVHSVILLARSALFRGMLSGKWTLPADKQYPSKRSVTLHEVSPELFAAAVHWMYTDMLPAPDTWQWDYMGLLQTADRLGCVQLSQLAQRQLESSMTVHNAPQLLACADGLNAELLRHACIAFIVRAFEVCSLTMAYQNMATPLRDEVLLFRRRIMAGDTEQTASAAAAGTLRTGQQHVHAAQIITAESSAAAARPMVAAVSPPSVGGGKRSRGGE